METYLFTINSKASGRLGIYLEYGQFHKIGDALITIWR